MNICIFTEAEPKVRTVPWVSLGLLDVSCTAEETPNGASLQSLIAEIVWKATRCDMEFHITVDANNKQ